MEVGTGLVMYDVYLLAMQLLLPTWGSKYLKYISRIKNTAMICSYNNGTKETMSRNTVYGH
jgi:hypothetical protein